MIPVKTIKRPSNLFKGTFIWIQVSVGISSDTVHKHRVVGKMWVLILNRKTFQLKIK